MSSTEAAKFIVLLFLRLRQEVIFCKNTRGLDNSIKKNFTSQPTVDVASCLGSGKHYF